LFSSRDPEVIRERLGAEVYQRVQRTRELLRSPQPLTEADAAVLRAAAAPPDLAPGGAARQQGAAVIGRSQKLELQLSAN